MQEENDSLKEHWNCRMDGTLGGSDSSQAREGRFLPLDFADVGDAQTVQEGLSSFLHIC